MEGFLNKYIDFEEKKQNPIIKELRLYVTLAGFFF